MWLAIGALIAALVLVAPWRWALAITAFVYPLTGTMVLALGANPIILPLLAAFALCARHAVTMLRPQFRIGFVDIVRRDYLLLILLAYAVVAGLHFPKLFAGEMMIYPAAAPNKHEVLGPHHINVPQIIYLGLGIYVYLVFRQVMRETGTQLVTVFLLAQAVLIGAFGLTQSVAGLAGAQISNSWIANNTGFAILQHTGPGGFVRVSSVFPEASTFGAWGLGALAFSYALTISGVYSRWAVIAVGILALTLILSTSSTAYLGLASLAAFAALHLVFDKSRDRRMRVTILFFAAGLCAVFLLSAIFSAEEGFLYDLRQMITTMTVAKTGSASAEERGRWAAAAWQAGLDSNLLGIGHGVLYSSGLFQAVFGMLGIIGLTVYVVFAARRIGSAFREPTNFGDASAAAGAFGLAMLLVTGAVSAPGLMFGQMDWIYAALAATYAAAFTATRTPMRLSRATTRPRAISTPAETPARID